MLKKFFILIKTVKNWYRVPFEKLFSAKDSIIYKFHNNIQIACRPKSTDVNESVVVLSGIEYPIEYIQLNNKNKRIIFDLGGNIGVFSVWFDSLNKELEYNGYVFEPHPGNIEMIKKNFVLNNMDSFEIINKAVSGGNETLRLDVSGDYDAFRIDEDSNNYIEVDAVRLSDFCKENAIKTVDLCKIDIEGGEYDLLSRDLDFFINNIKVILLEFHEIDNARNLSFLEEKLKKHFIMKIENRVKNGGIISAINKKYLDC